MSIQRPQAINGAASLAVPAAIFAACAASRLPFTSRLLYNMDSVQFALGMRDFDVALHQPQPPGYYLYVLMGRATATVLGDANTALIALSIIFSGLAAVMLFVLGSELFGRDTGITAAAFGITSPLMWFHGEVALSYMPEAFMSLTVAWLCLRTRRFGFGYAIAASVALGVAGGIRQNTMVFLMPLWLYAITGFGYRRAMAAAAAFLGSVAAWFLPMLAATGGYSRYVAALKAHWLESNWRGIHLDWIAFNAEYMSYFILTGLLLAVAPLAVYCINAIRMRSENEAGDRAAFFFLWLSPAIIFHLVVFTHPAVPGHTLIYLTGLIILAAKGLESAAAVMADSQSGLARRMVRNALLFIVVSTNTLYFIFWPGPLSARGINSHDHALRAYITAIRNRFTPKDTIIIGSDRFLYSFRHAMYYLPEFSVYNTSMHDTPDGPELFWGKGLETHLAPCITPMPQARNFVDFVNYREQDRPGLAQGAQVVDIGGNLLVYYQSPRELAGVRRIAAALPPGLRPPDIKTLP